MSTRIGELTADVNTLRSQLNDQNEIIEKQNQLIMKLEKKLNC